MDKIPFWFPKYIYMGNSENNDIWVLRQLIDSHHAYYWKVSGEWGRTIHYDGLFYVITCPHYGQVVNETLIPSSAEAFLKYNEEGATDWSMNACKAAWEEVKKINPMAKDQTFEYSSNGHWWHTETYYENIYKDFG